MERKIWMILGILFAVITIIAIILVSVLSTLKTKEETIIEPDWHKQSILTENNTDLWASFPGKLKTKTKHTFNILDYTEIKNNAKIKDTVQLDEKVKYENLNFESNGKTVFFDANSNFTLESDLKSGGEKINTINLGLFEALETLSNPSLYQKGINSINYLFKKAFQSPDIFIRHLFASYFFRYLIKDEEQVLQKILNNVDIEKARKILSNEDTYVKYSFKSISGFYQWVKILGKQKEINEATWLVDLFELTKDEINSIFGEDEFLYKSYIEYNTDLIKKYSCKDRKELIYKQLIYGEVTKDIDNTLINLKSLYTETNEEFYPFYTSPELYVYFEEYKIKVNNTNLEYEDYKINIDSLEKLIDQDSKYTLLSSNNSALFISLFKSKDEEKIFNLYGINLNQSIFLIDYFYFFLPKLLLYQEFKDQEETYTIKPMAKAFYTMVEKLVEKTYYKLIHSENLFNLFFSTYVWKDLQNNLDPSMEYDDEDICPLLFQHALDDGRKVLKICSDSITGFKTPIEILKWYDPYKCIKSGDETACNMTVINHLRNLVYITEDEIKSIYNQGDLGNLFEKNDKNLKSAFNCDGECNNDDLCKIQFWKSGLTNNLPDGLSKTDTLNELFPDKFPYPIEISYYAKKIGFSKEIIEEDINDLISISPEKVDSILDEDNYEAFNNKIKLEQEYTLIINGKKAPENRYNAMHILNNGFLFKYNINGSYDTVSDILEGSSEDEEYLELLSNGEYYENYKPGIKKTTGFNLGINLDTGEKTDKEYERYGMIIEDNENLRKIISINEYPFMNIKQLEYNYLINNFSTIDIPLYNFQTLIEEKCFVDGFQFDHDRNSIYYYDKISSRPLKFYFSKEEKYEDLSCRRYELDRNDLANNINEIDDINSNKALLSQKLNKPIIITVGKDELNTNIEDNIPTDNYICIQSDTNFVLDSKINLVYSIYTKNYGFINSYVENEKIYPIFTYNRNYQVDMQSFHEIFGGKIINTEEKKRFGTTFVIVGVIIIVLLAIFACFCFYKWYSSKEQRNSIDNTNLINDTRVGNSTQNEPLD